MSPRSTPSALSSNLGWALILWAVALDTWRPGRFPFGAMVLVGAVLILVGLVGQNAHALRASPGSRWSRWLVAAAAGAILLSIVGMGLLRQRGYQPHLVQFLRDRAALPAGTAQVSRAPDGALELTMVHGPEVSIERTIHELNAAPTVAQLRAAHTLLDSTRHYATRFESYDQAKSALGYSISTAALANDPSPSIEHLINPAHLEDDVVLDPHRPESLVFRITPEGKTLIGIMYMTKRGDHGPQVGGILTRWHYHPTVLFCMDSVGVPRTPLLDGQCGPGHFRGPSSEMLHVWLVDNPGGVFAHMMSAAGGAVPAEHVH